MALTSWCFAVGMMPSSTLGNTHILQKTSTFDSSVSTEYFQNLGESAFFLLLLFGQCTRQAYIFFLGCSSFQLGTVHLISFLLNLFLSVESWTPTFTETSKALRFLDVTLGSSVSSRMSRWCIPRIIFIVIYFLHLWFIGLPEAHWKSKDSRLKNKVWFSPVFEIRLIRHDALPFPDV